MAYKENPEIRKIMDSVYDAVEEKGLDAVRQITGYLDEDDPTYITGHNNARSKIKGIYKDDLIEELVRVYFSNKL